MRSLYRALKGGALAASLVMASLAGAAPAAAQTPAEFFRGKTVSLVVGFQAGGGFDAYARCCRGEAFRECFAPTV